MKTIKFLAIPFLALVLFSSCSNDDNPRPVNEEEVVTTLNVRLTPTGGNTITLTYRDLDGDGPNPPEFTITDNLAANTTYNGTIELLDETDVNNIDNITLEVQQEDDEHQFFYDTNLGTVAYTDMDANGNPVGLNFTLTTIASGTGNFRVTLRHEPAKDAAGVSNGDITNAGGETDITALFTLTVQ